jgi:hypothetical protein
MAISVWMIVDVFCPTNPARMVKDQTPCIAEQLPEVKKLII